MKTILTTLTLLFITLTGNTQDMYMQKMGEALGSFAAVKSIDDYKTVAAKFELISNAEATKWLPLYYHAQCYILMSFSDRQADENGKDTYLEVAANDLDKMILLAPDETEVYALQALYYTAKLVINPMTRGQEYGALTQTAIQQSLALDAENPRAKQLDLSNKVGTAQFFGTDISQFCEEANELLAVWDDYEQKSPFHPTWGKDRVLEISKSCNQSNETTPTEQTEAPIQTESTGNVLTIEINKLESNTGYVMLELLNENEETVQQTMGKVDNNTCTITISNLEDGNYSIRFYHDANENKKMDSNKYGAPLESYGFSNNARGFMGAPKYEKTLFEVSDDKSIQLKAR